MTAVARNKIMVLVVSSVLSAWGACGVVSAMDDTEKKIQAICNEGAWNEWAPHDVLREKILALGEDGRKALVRMARKDQCALNWLVMLDDKRVAEVIRAVLKDRKASEFMRAAAFFGAASMKDASVLHDAREAFRSESNLLVSAAAGVLGAVGDESDLKALRDAYGNRQFRGSTRALWNAVAQRGHEAVIDALVADANSPVWKENPPSEIVIALLKIGTTRSRREAMAQMERYRDPWFRRRAAEETYGVLRMQRDQSHDAAEIAEIDALLPILQEHARQ